MKKEITVQGVYLINQWLKVKKFLKFCEKHPANILYDHCLHNAIDDYILMCRDSLTVAFVQHQSRKGYTEKDIEIMVSDWTFDLRAVETVIEISK